MSGSTASGEWPNTLRGTRILVVEDETLVAMMVEDALIDAGAMVLGPVTSAPDALQLLSFALADGGVSAAVLDLRLGSGTATKVADVLREHGVPFLFATGYSEHCSSGAHSVAPVLSKPYYPHRLIETLAGLISAAR